MHSLEYIESMIIRPCNLSCQGCTTFSDLKWSGYTTWVEGKSQLEPWLNRVHFESWGVMGGEPLMNPELESWLTGVRSLMPNTQIRFVTNGLLLPKNRWVVDLLHELGNSTLKISYHVNNETLDQEIEYIKQKFAWQPVREYGIDRWITSRDFRFQLARPKTFLRTFRGTYENMLPHNSDPKQAFEMCVQQRCPMLFEGRIYKCGTAGLTPDLLKRFDFPNYNQWEPYIDSGLGPDCSDHELTQFINNFGKPHGMCRQCPSAADTDSIINHTNTVTFK